MLQNVSKNVTTKKKKSVDNDNTWPRSEPLSDQEQEQSAVSLCSAPDEMINICPPLTAHTYWGENGANLGQNDIISTISFLLSVPKT